MLKIISGAILFEMWKYCCDFASIPKNSKSKVQMPAT